MTKQEALTVLEKYEALSCGVCLQDNYKNKKYIDAEEVMKFAIEAVKQLERKKGKWIHERLASTTGGSYPVTRCSVCQNAMPFEWEAQFCPNCGADMRGEQDAEH